jgi:hypothetical protein
VANPNDPQLRYDASRVAELYEETSRKWLQVYKWFYRSPVRLVKEAHKPEYRQRVVRRMFSKAKDIVQTTKDIFSSCAEVIKGPRPDPDEIEDLFPGARVHFRDTSR